MTAIASRPVLMFPHCTKTSRAVLAILGAAGSDPRAPTPEDHYPVPGTFLFKADLSVAAAAPGSCLHLLHFMGSHGSCTPGAQFTSQNLF